MINHLVLDQVETIQLMANKFKEHYNNKYLENIDVIEIDPTITELIKNSGKQLRTFQEYVICLFNESQQSHVLDELIESYDSTDLSVFHTDAITLLQVVNQFETNEPNFKVISLIPVDMEGKVAFIVTNHMNS